MFNAWVLLKGLETLDIRVTQMSKSAAAVAHFLAGHPKVTRVFYPHHKTHPQFRLGKAQMKSGSTMLAFEVKGGKRAAFRLADALAVILISNNLGDAKSIITHPATTTHQRIGEKARAELSITDALLRLSVGLEAESDLIADLEFGLSQA